MNNKLKPSALLKHRIILQAAFCVEDLLLATEKESIRPWIAVVAEHMELLFEKPGKLKPRKEKH